jgi:UDP-2,3-diacylglucosamine pyrophosphatase LpxH
MQTRTTRARLQDETILVISDLHMGSGRDPHRGTWSPTEDFFWDNEFAEFLAHYGKEGRCRLVINGDMVDFLQVLTLPTDEEARLYGIPVRDISPRYGLRCSEAAAVFQMDRVLDGHPVAFQALADFLSLGNRVTIIKGNHDIQFFWESAQETLRRRLALLAPQRRAAVVRKNLEFLPWFFYIPGILYVEHGNQYEPATSFSNFLAPVLPYDTPGAGRHIELDLGSFLVRYFSNRMEVLDIRADNYRPLARYLQMFFSEHPLVFLSTARDVLRYLTKTVAKARGTARGRRSREYRDIVERNAELLRAEAVRVGGGNPQGVEELRQALQDIAASRATPSLSAGVNRYLGSLLRRPVRALLWIAPLYLMVFIADVVDVGSTWITTRFSTLVQEAWRLIVFIRLPHLMFTAVVVACALAIRQSLRGRNQQDALREDPVTLLRRAASYVAGRLKVPYVVFGHSHAEDSQVVCDGTTYFNSGTWIGVFSEGESLYRAVHQFSFVKFQDGRGELLHWDPQRAAARPVIVVDAAPFRLPERARWIRTLWNLVRRK